MDFDTLDAMRRSHPAWRLLAADHAPLVASFLFRVFIEPNRRTLNRPDLVSKLDDALFELGTDTFPRPAAWYLDDWASDEKGWLRKYYPVDSDQPHYDLTPAAEKALEWLAGLRQRSFVGTESRLMTVFELLRQLALGTEADPKVRIAELERRKARIEADIERIRAGHVEMMDTSRVKDRFQQMAATARGLLADFREVEQNFRDLDRAARERIATWDGSKGILLDEVFGRRDAIAESDQGKSFRAFWDFLMAPDRQEELGDLLDTVLRLDAVGELSPDRRLRRVHYDWLAAGEAAQGTVRRLSEQLRRYLDDRAWLENRRIMDLIREIRQGALTVRDRHPPDPFMELDRPAPDMDLSMERPLFKPPLRPRIALGDLDEGDEDIPADALFDQAVVDRERLAAVIRKALQSRRQVSLGALLNDHPLEQGLAELVAYLGLAAEDDATVIDDGTKETVSWRDGRGTVRRATMPLVIFCREAPP
uniref:DUF3375 domain-containing protein n=1 Tax=Candidatus Kentrum sp. FM TaxID=2126340 RepID=A0A450VNH9_9GAMM|nr:MAG: Protein of unknown function (DUF3375) [Candidatus Kentron sp. FM]VFJ44381.1 MAG: Protein of unknown function (DUF3375) [Candidatus Kentron sp. FM]VFK06257.1 MAG: Protein of unknown function (DUF3375) [Candidatus Kentron sp. FM]